MGEYKCNNRMSNFTTITSIDRVQIQVICLIPQMQIGHSCNHHLHLLCGQDEK